MTYKRNFVIAVKVGGKVLRENGDEVQLPFGSEYSVLLKNTNSVRAMAQISIDGVSAGPWYILGPNSSVEIERFNNSGTKSAEISSSLLSERKRWRLIAESRSRMVWFASSSRKKRCGSRRRR